jgi:FAD dependent oxidoreductase TIGR03364
VLPTFLQEAYGVVTHFNALAIRAERGRVELSDGRVLGCDHALVCSGDDFQTLFPREFASSGLTRCKLQMMRTHIQPDGWRLGPHVAGGLTLLHYKAFQGCPSLPALRGRLERERSEHLRWGIHVLASQNEAGEVALGDTHEYGLAVEPFCRDDLDQLVLSYLGTFLRLPDSRIAERWMGVFAKSTTGEGEYVTTPTPGVWIVNGVGGMGMTLSFGLAQEVWDAIERGWWQAPTRSGVEG